MKLTIFLLLLFLTTVISYQNCTQQGNGLNGSLSPKGSLNLSISSNAFVEGYDHEINIELEQTLSVGLILSWKISNSSVGIENDFKKSDGIIEIPSDQLSATITLQPILDNLIEEDESFTINFSNSEFKIDSTFYISLKDNFSNSLKIMSGGNTHNCMITKERGLSCAGYSITLGMDATTDSDKFKIIPTNLIESHQVVQIDSNGDTSCAILSNGSLWCWGLNDWGQLGIGNIETPKKVPKPVLTMNSGVTDISVGYRHTCAIKNSKVYCWGRNFAYCIGSPGGDGATTTPRLVSFIDKEVNQVATGAWTSCVIEKESGALKCWGYNLNGTLGTSYTGNYSSAVTPAGFEKDTELISMKGFHTCSQIKNGPLNCWGLNDYAQVGSGSGATVPEAPIRKPTPVNGLSLGVKQVRVGWKHTCALSKDNSVYCWGRNEEGQIGNKYFQHHVNTPSPVLDLMSDVVSISTGYQFSCAINSSGRVQCWGHNNLGQLGIDSTTNTNVPTDISPF